MSAALSASARLLQSAVRTQLVPRASLHGKPAKHPVSAAEQAFVFGVFFVTILGPSGWVLANLENYKKKQ